MNDAVVDDFLRDFARFYEESGRHDMQWRQPRPDGSFDPYLILVSELMLQQTQVVRVAPKFAAFVTRFPDVQSLAAAGLDDVLGMWSGLGYNRRAKYLHRAAAAIVNEHKGVFPTKTADLMRLPGVGPNTAGAIVAYAYDQPVVYLETNIRTVLIHHFFADQVTVTDTELRFTLETIINRMAQKSSVDSVSDMTPRTFYWAMMDYGAYIKKTVGNPSRNSASFVKQSTFHGSRRQIRGKIIQSLVHRPHSRDELMAQIVDDRLADVLADLVDEELIYLDSKMYRLVT